MNTPPSGSARRAGCRRRSRGGQAVECARTDIVPGDVLILTRRLTQMRHLEAALEAYRQAAPRERDGDFNFIRA